MGSRSIGELLLRPATLSRLSLSQPTSSIRLTPPSWTTCRTITNSSSPRAAQPQPKQNREPQESAPKGAQSDLNDPLSGFDRSSQSPPSSSDKISQSIDDLFSSMNNPTFHRRATPQRKTSSDELEAARASRVFGSNFSPLRTGSNRRQPLDINSMVMPKDDGLPLDFQSKPSVPTIPEEEKIYPRLNASYGRTVDLDTNRGRDIVRGISMLGSLIARNKIRSDVWKQRFHERPGLKRKRLKSERWRARFKIGFRDVTARVSELTRKGW